MNTLKNVLLVNGVSSGATGLLLVVFAQPIANLFLINVPSIFAGVGIFLVAFAAFVIMVALKGAERSKVRFIITLDILWVATSLLVILVDHSLISTIGNLLITAVALWVAAMAFLQTKNLKQVTL